jgi:hypothetical protein
MKFTNEGIITIKIELVSNLYDLSKPLIKVSVIDNGIGIE